MGGTLEGQTGMSWETLPILVAEDDDNDYFLLDRAIKKAGISNPVHRVTDGQEVVNYLCGTSPYSDRMAYPFPHLLLLDLKLPIKHGFDVLKWIRAREATKALLIIIHSSSKQGDDIHKSYELGANGYVPKATSTDDLIEAVAAVKAYWLKVNCGSPLIGDKLRSN